MQALYNGQDMKLADRSAICDFLIPSVSLMDAAAQQLSIQIRKFVEKDKKKCANILLLCGKNNNGGDGFCASRFLSELSPTIAECYEEGSTLSQDAQTYAQVAHKMEVPFVNIYHMPKEEITALFSRFDLIVDAIYGTGFSGEIRYEPIKTIIECVNESTLPVISVDVPSGVDSATGAISTPCIHANLTVTFAAMKMGLMLYPGHEKCGQITLADIGMPPAAIKAITPAAFITDDEFIETHLPKRFAQSHKGSYGRALCIGGSENMKGSIIMSAKAALLVGAGLVKLASIGSICDATVTVAPELLTMALRQGEEGGIDQCSAASLLEEANGSAAIAIGPGMGVFSDTGALIRELMTASVPVVADADALNILAQDLSLLKNKGIPRIITPHEMELARLVQKDISYVRQNKIACAEHLAKEYGIIVVAKGAHTIIATPDKTYLNPTGNPGMSTAGSGDVLTGMIVSLLAQGCPADVAAVLGVYLHGKCGDVASQTCGYMSQIASDLLRAIPKVLSNYEHISDVD